MLSLFNKQSFFYLTNTFLLSLLKMSLFPFDDAKVRRFSESCIIFLSLLLKKILIIDTNQLHCVRTHLLCARAQLFFH